MKDLPRGKHLCWHVQLEVPVDNPVYNVRMTYESGAYCFTVPINYPNVHSLGFEELFEAQGRATKYRLSTDLNKNSLDQSTSTSIDSGA